jgi:hypothetical protein
MSPRKEDYRFQMNETRSVELPVLVRNWYKSERTLSRLKGLRGRLSAELSAVLSDPRVDSYRLRIGWRVEDLWLLALGLAIPSTDHNEWLSCYLLDLIPNQKQYELLRSFLLSIQTGFPMWSLVPDKYRKDRNIGSLLGESKYLKPKHKLLRSFFHRCPKRTSRRRGYTDGKSAFSFRLKQISDSNREFQKDWSSRELQEQIDLQRLRIEQEEHWLSGLPRFSNEQVDSLLSGGIR